MGPLEDAGEERISLEGESEDKNTKTQKKEIKSKNPKKIEVEETPSPNEVEEETPEETDSSTDDEAWTYPSGEIKGLRPKPPMLDLDNLGSPKPAKVHASREEELTEDFQEAGKWVGIIMSINDFRKFVWSNKEDLSENTVIYAVKYDKNRRK